MFNFLLKALSTILPFIVPFAQKAIAKEQAKLDEKKSVVKEAEVVNEKVADLRID